MPEIQHSQSPWVSWYDYDEDGLIIQAGVDNANRVANVCVTTCENVEWADHDIEKANALIRADTELVRAAPEMLAALRWLLDDITDAGENRQEGCDEEYDSVANARAIVAAACNIAAKSGSGA